jgi:OFA family oxalate/formate antiporter-like MFS transporter
MPLARSPESHVLTLESPFRPTSAIARAAADVPERPDPRSRMFYGWMMVLLTTVVLVASSPGQTYGFTYFNPWLREALSLSQTELSATYLFATLLAAVPLGYVGALADRIGLKRSMIGAVAAMAGACLLAASVQNVPMLFAACTAMRLFGPGVMTLLANNTLAAWFDLRLGFASSAVQLAMAGATALVPIGLLALIASVGWREAYAALGLLLLAGVLPLVCWAYREDPGEVGQQRDGAFARKGEPGWGESRGGLAVLADELSFDLAAAVRTRTFWILIVATSVWSMIGTGLIFHLDALLASRGLGASEAAWATPVMAICMAAMQLAGGRIADRVAPGRLAAAALSLVTASCMTFAMGRGAALTAAYGVYGLGQGLMSLVTATVWTRYFGRRHLGRIRGTALTAAISASAVGPLVMGVSVDFFGGFEPSLWAFAAGAIVVAAISPWATRPETDGEGVTARTAEEFTLLAAA